MKNEKNRCGLFDEENPGAVTDIRIIRQDESAALTIFLAVVGAVLGSAPSMLLWVTLGKAGYVAAVAGFFMITGEMLACGFMTKKRRQMNIEAATVICIIVMAAAVYICERLIWSWELADLLYEEGLTFTDCFLNFGRLTEELDIKYDFRLSLVKSGIFAVLGAIPGYFKACKELKFG